MTLMDNGDEFDNILRAGARASRAPVAVANPSVADEDDKDLS